MMKNIRLSAFISMLLFIGCSSYRKVASVIPQKPSEAADYFCTWNIQGYVSSFSSSEDQRNAMNQKNLFGNDVHEHWVNFYKKLHPDLYFLLDDSWDVPLNGDKGYYGSLIVDSGRFPSVKGMAPALRLKTLSDKIKASGWKGLGLWICAQQAPKYQIHDSVKYWQERLNWMDIAGIGYWKVDWGEKSGNPQWRAFLTKLGKENAPRLHIEHAITPSVTSSAELYRTYDVENVISIPHTISRIAKLLTYQKATSIINCEDEPYIAAGTGCTIGVMRYGFSGNLPNGIPDFVFPSVGRDLKNRLDEVVRAVRWHRIAVPFGIDKTDAFIDTTQLHDYWTMGENESWIKRKTGDINAMSAPAIITRGLEKPQITLQKGDTIAPYILASKYPNGAIAVAAIGRTINREYITPRADVLLKVDSLNKPIGIFGCFNKLTFQLKNAALFKRILAQDLAEEKAVDVTQKVLVKNNEIVIPGKLVDEIGLMYATKGDKSEPGLVIIFQQ